MSIEGILLQPGEAQSVSLRGTQVDFLVTAEHAKGCSVFEFSVAPGFDTVTVIFTALPSRPRHAGRRYAARGW